jgi:type I restriction enzyme S subunit
VSTAWPQVPLRYLSLDWCDGPFGSGIASIHYREHGARVIRLQNIRTNGFNADNSAFIDLDYFEQELSRHSVLAGDILIAGLGDDKHLVGRACVAPQNLGPALVKADCFRFRVDPKKADSRFVAYALTSSAGYASGTLSGGSTRQRINLGAMSGRKVFLPKMSVQENIADFLDDKTAEIDALIAEKTLLVERLQEYQYSYSSTLMTRGLNSQAELIETSFPEIGKVPKGWTVERLKFLGEVRSGVAKGKDLGERDIVTLPYLRVANVQDGYVDLTQVYDIEVAASEAPRYFLRKNDVLMNEGGDNDKLGRGAVWQGQIDPCIHQNHVFAVRLNDPGLAEWVSCFTSTDAARTYFFLRSKQSTNLASINQSNVLELPVPMPPPDERKELLTELQRSVNATTMLVEHAIEHIARLREYRSSLISAAVTG